MMVSDHARTPPEPGLLEAALARIVDQQMRPALLVEMVGGQLRMARVNGHACTRFDWVGPNRSWTSGPPAPVRSIVERTLAVRDGLVEVPVMLGDTELYRLETTWVGGETVLLVLADVTAEYRRRDLTALWSDVIDDLDEIVVVCDSRRDVPSLAMPVITGSASARARLEEAGLAPTLGDVVGSTFGEPDVERVDALRVRGGQDTWRVVGGRRSWRVSARCVGGLIAVVLQDVSTRASIAQTLTDQARRIASTQADEQLVRRVIERVRDRLLPRQRAMMDEASAGGQAPGSERTINGQIDDLLGGLTRYLELAQDAGTRQTVHLGEVLDGVLAQRAAAIERMGARIHRSGLPVVWGSWIGLAEVFEHLIDNALAAGRPDVGPTIEVVAAREADGWRVSVADDGIGIPPEERERVFEPLYRIPGRGADRAGLGLAICRRAVARHGGEMGIESNGSGVRVWFDLRSH